MPSLLDSAIELHRAGRLDKAEALYRQILPSDPNYPDALHLLGVIHAQRNQHTQAGALIRQAIALKPDFAEFHRNLGLSLLRTRQIGPAIECYRTATRLEPNDAQTWNLLGIILGEVGQFAEAAEAHKTAVALRPEVVDYHANLAMDYLQSRRFPQAIAEFRTCIQHKPNELSLWHSFGAALAENGQFAEALDAFDRGLAIAPNSAALHSNRSATLRDLGRLDESYAAARRAIELDPNCPGAHNNLGALFYDDGRWEETLDAWRIACRTDPTAPGAHWNYARILLQLGHLEEGWEEFEWRLKVPSMFLNRKFPQPQWDGSDPTGKRILLHTEGGFGDALHFIRLVPELTARGGTWFLECQPELVRIFQNTPGLAGIIPRKQPLPDFDVQIPLQSLPRILKIRMDNIPNQVPYLQAPPEQTKMWAERLAGETKIRVGLVWAGSSGAKGDVRTRSVSIFAPFAAVEGMKFFSLQKGAEGAQLPPVGMDWADYTSELADFADVAALVQNLDLVISIDTAIVHLAGALAKRVWVLVPRKSDFRWLLDREDSPWYPTMRLFREPNVGDWQAPIAKMLEALRQFTNAAGGLSP